MKKVPKKVRVALSLWLAAGIAANLLTLLSPFRPYNFAAFTFMCAGFVATGRVGNHFGYKLPTKPDTNTLVLAINTLDVAGAES